MWFVFRALPEKRTTFPFFASEASNRLSNYKLTYKKYSIGIGLVHKAPII
ncbi:MAG: hypothetical protein U5L45_15650 [Saprospiraceae bacterium]|nr:hypothetical protein [Saprospiraceae bacterium]